MSKIRSGNTLLLNVCERLGLDSNTLKKGEEYFRVVRDKPTGNCISDFTKAVLCLELAATSNGVAFDKESAFRLSAVAKQSTYNKYVNVLKKLLNLDKPITVSELCVQLSCTEAKDYAEKLLVQYRESNAIDADLSHPQYVAAAVAVACKLKHIKVTKSQFTQISGLKPSQWKDMESKFQQCADSINLPSKKNITRNGNDFVEYLDAYSNDKDNRHSPPKEKCVPEGCEVEDYETWKKRILDESHKALQKESDKN